MPGKSIFICDMYLHTALVLSVIIGAVSSFEYDEYQYPQPCPRVRYITDLDFTRILGFWYRCFTTLNCPSCYGDNGQTVYAYPYNASVSNVAICCQSKANLNLVTCGPDVGTGTIKPLPDAGMFLYEADGESYPTVVLDADYDTFLISYACKRNSPRRHNDNGKNEQIYVYARSYHMCKSLEDRSRNVLKRNNIAWTLKPVRHGPSIPITTVPKPCSEH